MADFAKVEKPGEIAPGEARAIEACVKRPSYADLGDQEIDYPFEWIEAEGLSDGYAEIRVCVDVIEYEATIGSFQILDTTHVQPRMVKIFKPAAAQ